MTTSSERAGAFLAAGVVLAMFSAPGPALAQTSGQPSAADLESARELFKEGRELRQRGDLPHALERFKAAHAYGQTPVTALELGRTQIALGQLVEAREVLLSVARMRVQPDETDKSASARAEAAELAEDVKKRVATVTIKLTGLPADAAAQVTFDGANVPVVSLTGVRKANPGKHAIVVRFGSREETRNVEVADGENAEVSIDLATTSQSPNGSGGSAGSAGSAGSSDNGTNRSISPVTWVGLGLGGVGLGVGAVAGIVALGKAKKVDDACDGQHCPATARDDVSAGRTAATVSTIGFSVGVAGLATAAVGYFVLSKPKAVSLRVLPYVTASSVGLDGRF